MSVSAGNLQNSKFDAPNVAKQLTLITTCKPFQGHDAIHQYNAIRSWRYNGFPVLICGNAPDIPAICKELDCAWQGDVPSDANGLPYVEGLFTTGESATDTPYYAYLNSDIIIGDDGAVRIAQFLSDHPFEDFLLTGRRRNIPILEKLEFDKESWQARVDAIDHEEGSWDHPYAIDFFMLSKGWLKNIPPIKVGRAGWDNWMLINAERAKVPVVDASGFLRLYHPLHHYKLKRKETLESLRDDADFFNREKAGFAAGAIDQCSSHFVDQSGIHINNREHQKHFAVNINTLFRADIRLLNGYDWADKHQAIQDLSVVLARTLRFVPQTRYRDCELPAVHKLIEVLCSKCEGQKAEEAIDHLQDWLFEDLIEMLQGSDRPLLVWGAGESGERLLDFLARHNIKVHAVLDKKADDPALKNKVAPLPCHTPETLTTFKDERPFIFIASIYFIEMSEYLEALGFLYKEDYAF